MRGSACHLTRKSRSRRAGIYIHSYIYIGLRVNPSMDMYRKTDEIDIDS